MLYIRHSLIFLIVFGLKGVIFTEFLEMVESMYGYETVDRIIIQSKVASQGIYTSVGTYPHTEIVALMKSLSDETGKELSEIIGIYGNYLFTYFKNNYRSFFDQAGSTFAFLESVDEHIHKEVLKLYPDAELPQIETKTDSSEPAVLYLTYISTRKMSLLAESLIQNSIEYYKEDIRLSKRNLDEDESKVIFTLQKNIKASDHGQ